MRVIEDVKRTIGTGTGHCFNFIASILDIMNQHKDFKGYCLIMDNMHILKYEDSQLYIESHSYGCIHLPLYSPELNSIERFWSICKSKLKREALFKKETLALCIRDECSNVLISGLKGFCRYSVRKWDHCLEESWYKRIIHLVHFEPTKKLTFALFSKWPVPEIFLVKMSH